MKKINLLPIPIREVLNDIKMRHDQDNAYGHISWLDRIRLEQAMEESHGVGNSNCRMAVLAAKYTWQMIPVWEQKASDMPHLLLPDTNPLHAREFLRDCTLIFLGRMPPIDAATEEKRRRQLDDMWNSKLEPEVLVLPAVMATCLLLMFAQINNSPSEAVSSFRQEAFENEYNDFDDNCCDWEDRDCFFWISEIVGGDLRKPSNNVELRKEFWQGWLNNVVDANIRPLSELTIELEYFL